MGLKLLGMNVELKTIDDTVDAFNDEVKTCCTNRWNSCLAWTSFWLLFIGNVCYTAAYASPGWGMTREIGGQELLQGEYYAHYGIWYSCWNMIKDDGSTGKGVCELMSRLNGVPGWWMAFQGVGTIVVLLQTAAYITLLLYMCIPTMNAHTGLMTTYLGLAIAAVLALVAQGLTWVVMFTQTAWRCCGPDQAREILEFKLHYAFYMACGSCVLLIAAIICGFYDVATIKKAIRHEQLVQALHQAGDLGDDDLANIREGTASFEYHPSTQLMYLGH